MTSETAPAAARPGRSTVIRLAGGGARSDAQAGMSDPAGAHLSDVGAGADHEALKSPRVLSAKLEQARRFDAFVKRYRRPLLQYFRRRVTDGVDADDLVQIVFLRLLQKLQANDDSLSDAYVFTAASSVLIDHHRRRAVNVSGAAVELDPHLPTPEPDAHQILEDRQTLRVMLDSLSRMGSKWRRAFVLHRFESLSYAQIAKKMGVSASSVEKYVMAALAELRTSTDRDRHD